MEDTEDESGVIFLLPTPDFQPYLPTFLKGLDQHCPNNTRVIGAVASTVSHLTRPRIFLHNSQRSLLFKNQTFTDGCVVGVTMTGDIQIQTMIANGEKPVGNLYRVEKAEGFALQSIIMEDTSANMTHPHGTSVDKPNHAILQSQRRVPTRLLGDEYLQARIPKPVLAEANYVMRELNDDDQAFMRSTILMGITERDNPIGWNGTSQDELERLQQGAGHSFVVEQVLSASKLTGAVMFNSESVNTIRPGQRVRFYVRNPIFAKKEVEALWQGYKKRTMEEQQQRTRSTFTPTGCLLFPTIDRGEKCFFGKGGFESRTALTQLPTLPCVYGFFSNGIIGSLDPDSHLDDEARLSVALGTAYVLIGSSKCRSNEGRGTVVHTHF